jgi:hypothetical protein
VAHVNEPSGAASAATGLETLPPAAEPAAPDFGLPTTGAAEPEIPAAEPGGAAQAPPATNSPADDLWHDSAEQNASEGKAEQITIDSAAAAKMAQAPAKLPESNDPSAIRPATFEDGKHAESSVIDTAKPQLAETEPKPQPWAPLVVTIVLLACSLGGNVFLGWIAADARARYRGALAKLRGAAA